MTNSIRADELLEKNPDAREVFKKNQEKIANLPKVKKPGYRLAVPYANRRRTSDVDRDEPRPKASYTIR